MRDVTSSNATFYVRLRIISRAKIVEPRFKKKDDLTVPDPKGADDIDGESKPPIC